MNKKNLIDNKKMQRQIVKKVYDNIFKLDTKNLQAHELQVFKELISRKDYNELDFLILKYNVIQDELIARGVEL